MFFIVCELNCKYLSGTQKTCHHNFRVLLLGCFGFLNKFQFTLMPQMLQKLHTLQYLRKSSPTFKHSLILTLMLPKVAHYLHEVKLFSTFSISWTCQIPVTNGHCLSCCQKLPSFHERDRFTMPLLVTSIVHAALCHPRCMTTFFELNINK